MAMLGYRLCVGPCVDASCYHIIQILPFSLVVYSLRICSFTVFLIAGLQPYSMIYFIRVIVAHCFMPVVIPLLQQGIDKHSDG